LAVALSEEGAALRESGIDEPVLLLSEPPPSAWLQVLDQRLTPTVYTSEGVEALAEAARTSGEPVAVHLKVDTGMHRVGAAPEDVIALAELVVKSGSLTLGGVWTHLAVADEPDSDFTAVQLDRFADVRERLRMAGIEVPMVHAANSAGAIVHPDARLDMSRDGIALYGYDPSGGHSLDLRPAMSIKARVSHVKRLAAGERVSYGLRYALPADSVVATVPIGYADGVPRRLGLTGGEVLIGGQRKPIAGVVTMDQIMVDCGADSDVERGDEVVLIGRQGDETIDAEDWAGRLDTISYEIVCGIGPRVPRVYVG
jgi:alanine racemase